MAWNITGQFIDTCSCKILCPCIFGPADPDQGWCSFAGLFDIQQGKSDSVDLGGRKVVWVVDLPGDISGGNGTGRLYIDEAANSSQRSELEAILTGKKGGSPEVLSSLITQWLPTQYTTIEVQAGDNPSFNVGSIGQVKLQPIKTEDGRPTKLENVQALDALGLKNENLARGDGSHWFDPEMRPWVSGGQGMIYSITWSGG